MLKIINSVKNLKGKQGSHFANGKDVIIIITNTNEQLI